MAIEAASLTTEVRNLAKNEGAAVIGFAPVERWERAPKGHCPWDFVPKARSVIAFGMRISDAIVDYDDYHNHFTGAASFASAPASRLNLAKLVRSNTYLYMGHFVQDDLLAYLATKIAWRLEEQGFQSMPMPTTATPYSRTPELDWGQFFFPWSNRHAAVMTGLGEFGYNNIVLTPQYGPRIRFNSVITEAEFEYTSLLAEKVCLRDKCRKCLDACTAGAIQLCDSVDKEQVFITTPAKTDARHCLIRDEATGGVSIGCFFYGTCLRVCPIKPKLRRGQQ
jgi:epoxyqueuosine reductase QueG